MGIEICSIPIQSSLLKLTRRAIDSEPLPKMIAGTTHTPMKTIPGITNSRLKRTTVTLIMLSWRDGTKKGEKDVREKEIENQE